MDNTRLFLFAALSFVGMLIWQQWQLDYGPQPVISDEVKDELESAQNKGEGSPTIIDLPDQAEGLADVIAATPESTVAPISNKLITVETDVVSVIIDSKGGVIRSVKLKKYPVSLDQPEQGLELIHSSADSIHVLQSGLRNRGNTAPTHHSVYQTAKAKYSLRDGEDSLIVPLLWEQDGIKVIKTYEFQRGDYLIEVKHRVENNTAEDWQGSQYRQIQRTRPLSESRILITYTGAVYYNEEVKYEKVDFDDMEESQLKVNSQGGWIAMLQHYFLSAWVPSQEEVNLAYTIANTRQQPATYTMGLRSENKAASPGNSTDFTSQLFIGPKLVDRLEEITPGLELTVDYGVLTFLSKPLYWLLSFYQSYVGNWGLAIILLTLTIKAVFYKLSETSYRSMAKMRKVGPRLKTLKERYGSDRQKMNAAMMELYKTEKINPMGGCLPILVQIPVFIALYWALLETVDLRQAPFILWIEDLSVMDPYYVLPIIMGISMLVQQKLNPAPMDPIQAKVMMALPFVFTFFFAFFPSGLVLYWVVNNVLSIAQQWVITKRIEAGGS